MNDLKAKTKLKKLITSRTHFHYDFLDKIPYNTHPN